MSGTAALIAPVMLFAGAVVGWLLGTQRGQRRIQAEHGQLLARASAAETQLARTSALLEAERTSAADRDRVHVEAQARLREAFGALSAEALRQNNEAFVQLAEQRLNQARTAASGELQQRQQAVESIVAPLRDSLEKVQAQLQSVERERTSSYAALREQVGSMRLTSEQLRTETAALVTALRAPQVRGRWGELQLERTLESAGLTEHVDYVTQPTSTTDEGTVRPDVVINLVGGKHIVVDSKVAFSAYLEAMEAREEGERNRRLKAHARHLREHIDALGAKAYWERFAPAPEFVVCFVPADAFLDAALREEPTLLERAHERNVVVATPSTLVALLRTVAYTWRQEALAANAAEVHRLGKEIFQRLATMGGHIDKLGRSLNAAVGDYNRTVSSLESRVLVSARKMSELHVVGPDEQMPTPTQLTATTVTTQAPELTSTRLVSLPKRGQAFTQQPLPDTIGSTGS
jgi:DNA recombination protein RmuC